MNIIFVAVPYNKSDNSVKQATILFLIVFVLIKISPAYFKYQDIPRYQKNTSVHSVLSSLSNQNSNFLIKVDKSENKIDVLSVPPIKFAGILFSVFFGCLTLLFLNKSFEQLFIYPLLANNKIGIKQCIFRLWFEGYPKTHYHISL